MPTEEQREHKRLYDIGYRARKTAARRACRAANPGLEERTRRAKGRAFIDTQKAKGCVICGFSTPIACDFHHIDPASKVTDVTRLVCCSEKRILAEVAKCVVLCSNHHRMFHAGLLELP
jgi:hypothetical protein